MDLRPLIAIHPVVKPIFVHYIEILVEQVELNKGATCFVILYDDQKQPQDRIRMFIGGADYDRWIQDDDIIDVVLEKLNIQRKPVPEVVEEEKNEPLPVSDEPLPVIVEEIMDIEQDQEE
jgi:hypothetical protein